jgi:hypothetical protein
MRLSRNKAVVSGTPSRLTDSLVEEARRVGAREPCLDTPSRQAKGEVDDVTD